MRQVIDTFLRVRAEVAAAVDRSALVPALIGTASPPKRFRMIQSADLVSWHGRREHAGLTNLLSVVRASVDPNLRSFTSQPALPSEKIRRAPEKSIAIVEIETGENRARSMILAAGMTSLTIGRSRDCDSVVEEYYISRSHCRLEIKSIHSGSEERRQYRFMLMDFGNVTGTTVNGERVDRMELRDGDHLQIGSAGFRFQSLAEDAA